MLKLGRTASLFAVTSFLSPRLASPVLQQGKFTIIKDCAKVADNTVIPPNTVIPALSLFSGSPGLFVFLIYPLRTVTSRLIGRFIEDLPESTQEIIEAQTKQFYTRFQPLPVDR